MSDLAAQLSKLTLDRVHPTIDQRTSRHLGLEDIGQVDHPPQLDEQHPLSQRHLEAGLHR